MFFNIQVYYLLLELNFGLCHRTALSPLWAPSQYISAFISSVRSSTPTQRCGIKMKYYFTKKLFRDAKALKQLKALHQVSPGLRLQVRFSHFYQSNLSTDLGAEQVLRTSAPALGRKRWTFEIIWARLECSCLTCHPCVASNSQGAAVLLKRLAHVAELDPLHLELTRLSMEGLHNHDGPQVPRPQLPLASLVQTPGAT